MKRGFSIVHVIVVNLLFLPLVQTYIMERGLSIVHVSEIFVFSNGPNLYIYEGSAKYCTFYDSEIFAFATGPN